MAETRLSYLIDAKDRASATFKKVSGAAKDTKQSLDQTSVGAKRLSQQISETEKSVAKMRAEFERTGDADLLKNIRKGERELTNLRGWAQQFPREVEDAGKKLSVFSRVGVTAGNGLNFFATAATDAGGAAKIAMHPLGATAIAVGAVGIGAVASGAALAGLGAGIIGLGAVSLSNSQRVQTAFAGLGATVGGVSARAASVLEDDFIGALDVLGKTASKLEPTLARMFGNMSPAVGQLATGISGLASNALPGMERAAFGANQVLGDVAEVLPELGDAVGDFGTSLGEAADGGGQALVDTLGVLSTGIRNTGNALEGLSKSYRFIKDLSSISVGDTLGVSARRAADEVERLSQKAITSEQGFSTFAAGVNMAKAAVEAQEMANLDLAKSMQNVSNLALQLAGSEIAAIDARHRMVEELKNGTRTLDVNTDAGRRNKQAILDGVAAAIRYGEAETKRTNSSVAGAAAQQRHTDAMYANALAVMKDKGAVDALWRSLGLLPPSKAVPVSAPGASAAAGQVNALRAAVYNLPTFRRLSIVTEYRTIGRAADVNVAKRQAEAAGAASGGLARFAGGSPGPIRGPGTGTSDSILARLSNGEFVTKASSVRSIGADAMQYMNSTGKIPAAAAGGNTYNLSVYVAAGASPAEVGREVIGHIQAYERRNGNSWRT